MKNLFRSLLAAAVLFGAAACATEDVSNSVVVSGETVTVTFTANLGQLGTRTATIGNASHVNRVYLGVYEHNNPNNYLNELTDDEGYQVVYDTTEGVGKASFSVVLLKDKVYDLVFWAQKADVDCYEMDWANRKLNIDYTNVASQAEERDAFFLVENDYKAGDAAETTTFTLKRPFAQLNAGLSADEVTNLKNNGVIIKDEATGEDFTAQFLSKAVVSNVATTLLLGQDNEGLVANPEDVTFLAASWPAEALVLADQTAYTYVSMNYLLVNEQQLVEVAYEFTDNEGTTYNRDYSAVPVQRNFRTNIVGALLSSPIDFNVVIDPGFTTPDINREIVHVANTTELQAAINAASTDANDPTEIILSGDIDLSEVAGMFSTRASNSALVVPAGKNVLLNLGGYTLSQAKENTSSYSMIENNGTLTVSNGTILFTEKGAGDPNYGWGSNTINNLGTLTVANGGIVKVTMEQEPKHALYAINTNAGATLNVNGGSVLNPNGHAIRMVSFGNGVNNVVVNDGLIEGNRAIWMQLPSNNPASAPEMNLVINGGTLRSIEQTYNLAIYIYSYGQSGENVTLTINGGTFDGNIALDATTTANMQNGGASVYGGTFNGQWGIYSYADDAVAAGKLVVHGGTFATDYALTYLAQTSVAKEVDGKFVVVPAVAQVDNKGYETFAEAFAAAADGKTVKLINDTTTAEVLTVGKGKNISLDLNGKSLNGWSETTGKNYNFIDVNGGTLTVENGTITAQFKGANMGWNSSTNVFNVTAGGVLNLNNVEAKNLGGSDMGFVAHLNNWGEVTLNVENATLESNYVAVRVFNSGYDKNNVTIKNSTLKGGNYAFWVHNYTVADFGTQEKADAQKALLNFDIWGNGNTFIGKNDTPIRYGMTNSVYFGADVECIVTTAAQLEAAISNGATITLAPGTYVIPNKAQGKTLTFVGAGDPTQTVIATKSDGSYEGCNYAFDGSTVTFENICINTTSTTYVGYARCKGTYKNCVINGTYTLYDNSKFEGCTFNVSGDVYNIWTWGAPNAEFDNCVFNSDGKALLLYGQANTKLTVNNSTFNDNGGLADLKAAIEIGNDYNTSYELIVNNTVVNGYEVNDKGINTGTTLWANKNSMGQDKLNVIVDGVDVY